MSYSPSGKRYNEMLYNRVGKSGLKLPAISLGLWQHFGETDVYANCKEIVCRAFDLGITHFDLANNYGNPPGSSEDIIGRILNTELEGYRDEILITTKAGYDMWSGPYGEWGSKKYLVASLDQSLRRMGLDYVDMFYSHRFDPDTPLEETMGALDLIVRQGKALYVGISNYDLENTKKAVQILKDLGTPCLINQPSYSMFNRWIEDGLQDFLEEEGIGTIIFQPMQRGLITNTYLNGIPADRAESLKEIGITEERIAKARKLNEIAVRREQSLAQMAIAWTLRGGRVASVLAGADKILHVEENVKALNNLEFSKEELSEIDEILK
ncbi:MAG: aldo/keto reductase [Melioribacteraceae bacterium]|nr:aldo/keto reductase [Melioribacteraceae bacterium]MCF8265895.1 aldo/keto reductase [Melioribacteraceae bacterium]MCF8414339.1 aldo/keto reductase [Melioribacteraceae bacterium]MCF8432138.1 aldo/keto reductase [Melioribacteraceae bacterium]